MVEQRNSNRGPVSSQAVGPLAEHRNRLAIREGELRGQNVITGKTAAGALRWYAREYAAVPFDRVHPVSWSQTKALDAAAPGPTAQ